MIRTYKIGEYCFSISFPEELAPPDGFEIFHTDSKIIDFTYELELGDKLPEVKGRRIADRPGLNVFETDHGEIRLIGVIGGLGYYACYEEVSETKAKIICIRSWLQPLSLEPGYAAILALEKHLIRKESLILHCAYIREKNQAILFSAPSGVGKSTQAGLWEQYKAAETINGDKCLLSIKDSQWYAEGYPVCGSSGICKNESYPVKAIVMLSQKKENQVQLLTPMQAFREMYSQIMINHWNSELSVSWMDLLQKLITEVPVYHLSCNISEAAVTCLDHALTEQK